MQVTPEVQAHLEEAGVEIKPYDALLPDVKGLAASGKRIWTDPDKVRLAGGFKLCVPSVLTQPHGPEFAPLAMSNAHSWILWPSHVRR